MLDRALLKQLADAFSKLETEIQLCYRRSDHAKQVELVEMLTEVASTSANITAVETAEPSAVPHFHLQKAGEPIGIAFTGVPGGHEFTSLILAILYADGKGKQPDAILLDRVRRLKGPIQLRTFVSLSCENCPEVVQSLSLMATHHPAFEHEMVDGGFVPDEVERLRIQGVPAVFAGDTLVSSGKASLTDLIERLEKHFGADEEAKQEPIDLGTVDVAVIGGGPAGTAAAIYTARKGLKTVVMSDRLGGQLQDTAGIENFISVPMTEGPQLSAALGKHMSAYDIQFLEHRRVQRIEHNELNALFLDTGEQLKARAVVVATGAKWRELGVEGEREYLGHGVAFCPHCDGPYYKGKDIAVVGGGNSGIEAAIDLAGMVKSVTVVEFMAELKADAVLVEKLNSLPNVTVMTNARTTRIVGDGQKVTALEYEDRATKEIALRRLDGVFVQIGLVPNSGFLKGIVDMNQYGEIQVDEKCRTSVQGIYAAGDVTTVPYKQIIIAMGEGAKAGLAAFEDQMV